jgi:transcriptional regulator with XRE-family HTH domain
MCQPSLLTRSDRIGGDFGLSGSGLHPLTGNSSCYLAAKSGEDNSFHTMRSASLFCTKECWSKVEGQLVNTSNQLWKKLAGSKRYREEFVAAQVKKGIPFQIRTLMKKHNLSQQELAKRSDLTQGVISRAANPEYGNLTLNTIIRIAAGLDVAFVGKFVSFNDLAEWFSTLSEDSASVQTFEQENAELERTVDENTTAAAMAIASGAEKCATSGDRLPSSPNQLASAELQSREASQHGTRQKRVPQPQSAATQAAA